MRRKNNCEAQQVHLGSGFRAFRCRVTTHLAMYHRASYERQGSRHKFLAVRTLNLLLSAQSIIDCYQDGDGCADGTVEGALKTLEVDPAVDSICMPLQNRPGPQGKVEEIDLSDRSIPG